MTFLVDAQLPPALARWLSGRGHAAVHVVDLALERATDTAVWAHAAQTGAVVVTKDEDFATRRQLTPDGPPIVWIRIGNTTNPELLLRMEAHLPNVVSALGRGEMMVEIS
jgi:predicted nuclease of predicted toxin-antitoxin system